MTNPKHPMRYRTFLVLLIWMNLAPAAAQKATGALLEYDPETIEMSPVKPGLDSELLFSGVLKPPLVQAKRAWEALTQVGQPADLQTAVAAIKDLDPTQKDHPWAATYVDAWVRLRQGDFVTAAKKMEAVLASIPIKSALQTVRGELLMMHALAGSDVPQAVAALGNVKPLTPLLLILADEYEQVGDEPRRLAALKLAEEGASHHDLTLIRNLEIETELRLDHPERVVALLRAQLAQTTEEMAMRAHAYHSLFGDTLDDRHRAAAASLYDALLAPPPAAAGLGTHQARVAALAKQKMTPLAHLNAHRFMRLHINEVMGCYRRLLQTESNLAGKIVLRFIVDASGAVTDIAANPERPADKGLSALGRCVVKKAKSWRFPHARQTAVTQPFSFLATQ